MPKFPNPLRRRVAGLPAAGESEPMSAAILPASPSAIEHAARLLRAGQLVAFPTETVYGLGADATNERAVAAIFEAKGRPHFNPLIVHVPGLAEAEVSRRFDDRARRIAAHFWPGPLSLVLPRRGDSGLSLLASAGLDTVAIRAPAHPVAQALLHAAERPIAAPSANRSGRVSPTEAAHVAIELGDRVALILDGGRTPIGLELTVLDLSGEAPALLRPGGVTFEELTEFLGPIATPRRRSAALSRHAGEPLCAVPAVASRSDRGPPRRGAARLRPRRTAGLCRSVVAQPLRRPRRGRRQPVRDAAPARPPPFTGIAVTPIPEHGLGRAINDRLRRAATPRRG